MSDDPATPTPSAPTREGGRVAVVGCGLVGRSWAIAFARGGFEVALHDASDEAARAALRAMPAMAEPLAALGLLGGEPPERVLGRVRLACGLAEAVVGAAHVQESAPERLDLKRPLLAEIDRLCPPGATVASSTSALMPSALAEGLAHPERLVVAHPLNPPHLIPAVEVVPHPGSAPWAVDAVCRRLRLAGQSPVLLARETEGFVMNRLQGALLDEAFALVAEGVAAPEDVDRAVRSGLARRWALTGPFETIDLNAPGGVADWVARYGPAYEGIGRHRPHRPSWNGALLQHVEAARRERLPAEARPARMAWRDRRLAALAAHARAADAADDEMGR